MGQATSVSLSLQQLCIDEIKYMIDYLFVFNFSRGNASQPIWLDNLYCGHTDKTCIGYCQTCPSKETTDCSHSEDLTVQCSKQFIVQ